jgi:hypothetical protein
VLCAGLALLEWLVGLLGNTFLFVIFCQVAFLLLVVFLLITALLYLPSLPYLILLFAAYYLHKNGLTLVFGALFLIVLASWKTLEASPRFRRTSWITAGLLACVLGLSLVSLRTPPPSSDAQARKADLLRSLPYLAHVEDDSYEGQTGVIHHEPAACASGLNLYNSYYLNGARLCDMSGNVLHSWRVEGESPHWQYVTLCPDGDLLVCVENTGLLRLDWESRVLWKRQLRVHHDVVQAEDGDIYVLSRGEAIVHPFLFSMPIINDYIEIFSSHGKLKKRISLYDILKEHVSWADFVAVRRYLVKPQKFMSWALKRKHERRDILPLRHPFDIFHNNTLTIMDRDIPGVCRKGDLLISARDKNLIGIVDVRKEELTWSWGPGELQAQHDPTLMENGHVLVFDNGRNRGTSRLVELDPVTKKIVWEYGSSPAERFFSSWGGAAQSLDNGNILITITNKGRVIEIDRKGAIVWDFLNPQKGKKGKRATIYRMTRVDESGRISRLLRGTPEPRT